jgi:hypothetical protein
MVARSCISWTSRLRLSLLGRTPLARNTPTQAGIAHLIRMPFGVGLQLTTFGRPQPMAFDVFFFFESSFSLPVTRTTTRTTVRGSAVRETQQ